MVFLKKIKEEITSNKPGLAMVLELVMGGMSVLVVSRFTELTSRAQQQSVDRIQDDSSMIRARELAEIGTATIKLSGVAPQQWHYINRALTLSNIPTADEQWIQRCMQKVGDPLETTDSPINHWNIRPDADRRIQKSARFEVNELQVAIARMRGYILVGEMVNVENSVAALGVNPTMVIGCGLDGHELSSTRVSVVTVSMVTVGGQVIVGDIRER